jgi:hypothetical protein
MTANLAGRRAEYAQITLSFGANGIKETRDRVLGGAFSSGYEQRERNMRCLFAEQGATVVLWVVTMRV